jgi:hypothetical protein
MEVSALSALSAAGKSWNGQMSGGRNPPGKTLVAETLVVGRRCAKKACAVLMMPILVVRVSASIRHNIAQERQEESVVAEQNNTCVPVWRARESAERRSYTKGAGTFACDASIMLSAVTNARGSF